MLARIQLPDLAQFRPNRLRAIQRIGGCIAQAAPILAVLFLSAWLGAPNALAQGDGAPRKEPGPKATGKVYSWQYEGGPRFEYFLPKEWDPAQPITLTMVLHGSNLDRRWGFANHAAGAFRPNDLVVCPDGTTSNGNGGYNFLQSREDLQSLRALQEALQEAFTIRSTFLYGHSQGSFFSLLYAGAYPDHVQGVVAHASGSWIGTAMSKKHHHQAIVHMHGSLDPVVSFGQSVGSHEVYLEKGYPLARLRVLQDYNHWPAQAQTGQELAWCEAMTSSDSEIVARSVEALQALGKPGGFAVPYGAVHQAALRLQSLDGASPAALKMAGKLVEKIEKQAEAHAKAIRKSLGKSKPNRINGKPWSRHGYLFLREYGEVPAAAALANEWDKISKAQTKAYKKLAAPYYQNRRERPAKAVEPCAEVLAECFLVLYLEDAHWADNLERWLDDAKDLGIKKKAQKEWAAVLEDWRDSKDKGRKAYLKIAKGL